MTTDRRDRIHALAVVALSASLLRDDWVIAVALAIDAWDAGVRPAKDGSRVRVLADFNPALWGTVTNRKAAIAVFDHLATADAPFVGVPV